MAHQLGHKVTTAGAVVATVRLLSLLGVGTSLYLAFSMSGVMYGH